MIAWKPLGVLSGKPNTESEKGKPGESRGRKAPGLRPSQEGYDG
jgi:hypothetical protein